MKIWIDDIRKAPNGWIHLNWPEGNYPLLDQNLVAEISLDNDLGNDSKGTGLDILNYIERNVIENGNKLLRIFVHTINPVARIKMITIVKKLSNLYNS